VIAGSTGLTGDDFRKLVKAICFDFPSEHLESILYVLHKNDEDILSFNEVGPRSLDFEMGVRIDFIFVQFVAGVRGCLLYGDFLRLAEELFE
jgi:hypothetical protein